MVRDDLSNVELLRVNGDLRTQVKFKVSVEALYFERLDHFSYKHEVNFEVGVQAGVVWL